MKKLIILFTILIMPLLVNASDVYYCSEDSATGFRTIDKDKYEVAQFNPIKFKILIDFENQKLISSKILFSDNPNYQKCILAENILSCMSKYGVTFSINKKSLLFYKSSIYNSDPPSDDLVVSYGTCEKF